MAGPAEAREFAELKEARTRLRAQHKQQVRDVQSEVSRLQAEVQRLDADFEQQDAALEEKHQTLVLNILLGPPGPLQAPGPDHSSQPALQVSSDCSPQQHDGPALAALTPLNTATIQSRLPELNALPAGTGHVSNKDKMDVGLDASFPTLAQSADVPAAEALPAQPEVKDPMSPSQADQAASLRLEAMRAALAKASNAAAQQSGTGAETSLPDARQTSGRSLAMFHYSLPVIPSALRECPSSLTRARHSEWNPKVQKDSTAGHSTRTQNKEQQGV